MAIVVCPNCKFKFDTSYARAFACRGCPSSYLTCGLVKCPKCGKEFERS
ncbi:MAG: hypothetical protein QMD21_01195 [Candidatus Thermoplasmatota archaeon]|nr:hypothetical protein [Candidatus Thermoplasmatota archaeon]MDI6855388.1 hypothetical protein [Candidatus Thermoplasmatota archaeon]MDI6887813.1 hypothetical protein [Candidatus Thermoplasmatota archaeon]